jgi:hypothetical protein
MQKIAPKTLEAIVELTNANDGKIEPKAFIAKVASAEEGEYKPSNYGGKYWDQKVTFESGKGLRITGYSKNPEVDFQDLEGLKVVVSVPAFNTKAAQIVARANQQYVNFNLGSKVEVWDAGSEELINDLEKDTDYDSREWRFDLKGGSSSEDEQPTRRNSRHQSSGNSSHQQVSGGSTGGGVNFASKLTNPMSAIAAKFGEAVQLAQQIADQTGITDERAIAAMAATIFINYSHQPGASMEPEEADEEVTSDTEDEPEEVDETTDSDEEEEPEEVQPKRRGRKPATKPEPEPVKRGRRATKSVDEDESPKSQRGSRRSVNSTKTSATARGSRKTTSRSSR